MFYSLILSGLVVALSGVVGMLGLLFSKRAESDSEKASPFECGFDPVGGSRIPFSMRFFLLAVIFLIFDVEIVLLFPMISLVSMFSSSMFVASYLFILILMVGLFHEWKEGSLDWVYS
nr:NADH dehydrogenase subunit 3 [Puncturella cf. parvinobilis]